MAIGLSTYAFFWEGSDRVKRPLSLLDMIERTASLGARLLQISDYAPLANMSVRQLRDTRVHAERAGIGLEVGGRGTRYTDLVTLLRWADALGARFVRSMLYSAEGRPSLSEAEAEITRALPAYRASGVSLGLETYEMVATADLVSLVESVGDSSFGIVLDASNVVARLEHPRSAIAICGPYVLNLHVKDFRFERAGGLVGFSLTGCRLGTGLLDVDHLFASVRPAERGISQVVEHWLPWQKDEVTTIGLEREWTLTALEELRMLNGR